MSDWQPIETAPIDGTKIIARESAGPRKDPKVAWAYRYNNDPKYVLSWTHEGGGIMLPYRPDEWKPIE